MKKKKKMPLGYYYDSKRNLYKYSFTFEHKRYYIYGETIATCEEKKNEKLELLKNHMNLDNQTITLKSFYSSWIEELAHPAGLPGSAQVKPSTVYCYQKSWRHLEKPLGHLRVKDISKEHILAFRRTAAAAGTSAATINKSTRLLKQILNAAVNDRIINYNPCSAVKYLKSDRPKATETNHRALSREETKIFLQHAEQCHYYNLFRFLLNTGCRIGESAALTWFDINFHTKEININKTVSRTSNKGYEITTPKTKNSKRTIPMDAELERILEQQKEMTGMLFGKGNSVVFPNMRGEVTNYNNVNVCIAKIVQNINAAGIDFRPFSVHAFRDTAATHWAEQGMPENAIEKLLGHQTSTITRLYTQTSMDYLRQEKEKAQVM